MSALTTQTSFLPNKPIAPVTRVQGCLPAGHRNASSIRRQRRQVHRRSLTVAVAEPVERTAAAVEPFTSSDFQAFLKGYRSQHVERSGWIEEAQVEGTIPPELQGTLLRNGPGLFEVGSQRISQPFDGDGLICMLAFANGKAFFSNRYVRTKGFVEEQQAQRLLYRGAFSVGNPAGGFYSPFDLSVKGVANTGVVHFGGKVLALYERDLPWEVSTPTLHTKGQTVSVPSKDPYFGAHYCITQDEEGRRRLHAFNAAEVGGRDNILNCFEYDEDLNLLNRVEVTIPDAAFGFFQRVNRLGGWCDFMVTPDYYVFIENPMSLDLWRMASYVIGRACIAECIAFDGERKKTKTHLIPRAAEGTADPVVLRRVFETDPFFSFHHSNAFTVTGPDGSPCLVLETVANLEGIDFSANFESGAGYFDSNEGRGTLTRLVINLRTGIVKQHPLMERSCEFPSVAPSVTGRPHRHIYVAGSRFATPDAWGPAQVVCKVSLSEQAGVTEPCTAQEDSYYPGRRQLVQEPVFVPREGGKAEDDGWVMVLVYDADLDLTKLLILEAQQLSAGPVATITLPQTLPMGLHGSWTSSYLGPPPDEPYAATEYDIRRGVAMEGC